MENLILQSPAESLTAELARQLEAYCQSLENDEIFEVRKKIALRIVEIEKDLVDMRAVPAGYTSFRNRFRQY